MENTISSEREINRLKRSAKRIKKEKGISHSQALDIIASELGYKCWGLMLQKLANNHSAEILKKQTNN